MFKILKLVPKLLEDLIIGVHMRFAVSVQARIVQRTDCSIPLQIKVRHLNTLPVFMIFKNAMHKTIFFQFQTLQLAGWDREKNIPWQSSGDIPGGKFTRYWSLPMSQKPQQVTVCHSMSQ